MDQRLTIMVYILNGNRKQINELFEDIVYSLQKCKVLIIRHTGRALIAGDGAIPQINRFAGMYSYSKLSINVFNKALMAMSQKSANPTGNE